MASAPDPKHVEKLNALSKGRLTRGKWRVVGALVLIVLLLLAGAAAVVETHRQANISDARKELVAELDALVARHADVGDLGAWYMARMPENWGGHEFAAWSTRVVEVNTRHANLMDWRSALRDELLQKPGSYDQQPEQLDAFMTDSDPLIADARGLLRFDCLTPLPDLGGNLPVFDGMPRVYVIHVLDARIWGHASRGDWGRAWEELFLWRELSLRLTYPNAAIDNAMQDSHGRAALSNAVEPLQLHPPEREVLEALTTLNRQPLAPLSRVAEGERAYLAILVRMVDDHRGYEDALLGKNFGTSSFSYLSPALSWEQRHKHFSGAPEMIQGIADYYRVLRLLAEGEIDGQRAVEMNSPFASWIETALQSNAVGELICDQIELMARIRLAEIDHDDPLPHALAAAALYPNLELTADDKHWTLRLRFTPAITAALFETWRTEADFYETHEPINLTRGATR